MCTEELPKRKRNNDYVELWFIVTIQKVLIIFVDITDYFYLNFNLFYGLRKLFLTVA